LRDLTSKRKERGKGKKRGGNRKTKMEKRERETGDDEKGEKKKKEGGEEKKGKASELGRVCLLVLRGDVRP